MIEDYEQIFPEDPYGEEAGPNARVFKVYNEEAAAYDADMIGQSSDSSDVLLVFVCLLPSSIDHLIDSLGWSLLRRFDNICHSDLAGTRHGQQCYLELFTVRGRPSSPSAGEWNLLWRGRACHYGDDADRK